MSTILVSGASERYGWWLLNMVGSVQANSPRTFDRIVLYDLGLGPLQRLLARSIRGAELRDVPPFAPHWREGRTWKTWIWTQFDEGDDVFWLDAGITVLRPLDDAVTQIREHGYFAVSQGHPVADSIPSDYYELYGFPRERADSISIAAGILGFHVGSDFYERVIVPTHEDALRGLSVGFSAAEVDKLNTGLDRTESPVIRDCRLFRHEQTLLNLHFYLAVESPLVADVYEYGGWKTPHDHPKQVIWSHRRRGDHAYLARARYRNPAARLFGHTYRARWWASNHSWLFRPHTYLRKLRAPFR
jgi:hypothetical protein